MKHEYSPLIGVCRWVGLCLLLCFLCAGGGAADPEPDHRASLEWDAAGNSCRLKWPALAGRTYFMQYTPDLLQDWIWIPAVVSGHGETKTWAFDVAGEKGFWRLVSSDIPTEDPPGDDFDGDGVSNLAELLQGTHPLENHDSDHDGFPDDWETGAGLDPSDSTDGADVDSDGDGLTNAEERLEGTLMQNPDSDGDGVEDGRDGWARNAGLSPARLPRSSYAALALDQLGLPYIAPDKLYEALYTADMNDQGLIRMKDATGSFFFVPWTGQVFRYPAGHTIRPYARMSNAGTIVSTFGSNGTGVWHYNGTWTPAVPHMGPLGPGEPHHYLLPYGAACTNTSGSLVAEITGQSVQDPPPYNNPTYAEKWGYDGHGFWSADVARPPEAAHHYHYRFYYDFGTDKFNQITTGGTWLSPRHLNDQNLALGSVRQVAGGTRSSAEQFSDGPTGQFMIQTVGPGLTEAGGAPQILSGGVGAWVDVSSQDSAYIVGGREIGYTGYYEPLIWQKRDGAWQMTSLAATIPDMNYVWDVNSRAQFIGSTQRGDEYREVLVENGAVVDLDEKLASSGWKDVFPQLINESGVILAAATKTQDQSLHGVLLVPMDMAVDANRDGEIQMGSPADKTTQNKPYRFWVNDDNDSGDEDHPGSSIQDYANFEIEGKRDLEDFARLHLDVGGLYEAITNGQIKIGLKWKNVTGSPSIRVYRAVEGDGKDKYLKDDNVAGQQVTGVYKTCITDIQNRQKVAASGFIFPASFWSGLNAVKTKKYLLFEVSGEGEGQLVLTVHNSDGTEIGESSGVWLNLKNVRKLYERAKISVDAPNIPNPWNNPDPPFLNWVWDPWNWLPDIDPYVEAKTIVFIHGWRMPYDEYISWADSSYKRLWHVGYKGRFYAFRWPTYSGENNGLDPVPGAPPGVETYNPSEYRAWLSGPAFSNFVNSLPNSSARYLIAHSMGNVISASALLNNMNVKRYAMCNSAMAAMAYNGAIQDFNYATADTDLDESTRRAFGLADKLSSVSTEIINFGLGPDHALGVWDLNNQLFKPQIFLDLSHYQYMPENSVGRKLEYVGYSVSIIPRAVSSVPEAMGYVTQSRSHAAGAKGEIGNRVVSYVDMGEFGFEEEHSAQWVFSFQRSHQFWREVLTKFGIDGL